MSDDFRDIRPDKRTTGFTLHWTLWVLGIGLLLSAILGAIGFAAGWISLPAKVFGVENVREQWRFAYEYNESLSAIQGQFCTAQRAVAESVDDAERSQRTTQRIAIENNYNRVQAQYDAKLKNAFEAKLVRPGDVPEKAPDLNRSCPNA